MRALARHVAIRIRMFVASASTMAYLLFAALGSLLLWPWIVAPDPTEVPGIEVLISVMTVLLWPMLVAILATGPSTTLGFAGFGSSPFPALPIGPRARSLGNASAAMLLILATAAGSCLLALIDPRLGAVLWFSYPFTGGVVRRFERNEHGEGDSRVGP